MSSARAPRCWWVVHFLLGELVLDVGGGGRLEAAEAGRRCQSSSRRADVFKGCGRKFQGGGRRGRG